MNWFDINDMRDTWNDINDKKDFWYEKLKWM